MHGKESLNADGRAVFKGVCRDESFGKQYPAGIVALGGEEISGSCVCFASPLFYFLFCYPRSQSSSCHSRHLLKSLCDLHAENVLHVSRLDETKATLTLLLFLWPVASLRRYFVLDPESGQLHYFVNEQGRSQKPRGSLPLFGASVTPSDEAPHMFVVNSVNGELYKLRGESPRRFGVARYGSAQIPSGASGVYVGVTYLPLL